MTIPSLTVQRYASGLCHLRVLVDPSVGPGCSACDQLSQPASLPRKDYKLRLETSEVKLATWWTRAPGFAFSTRPALGVPVPSETYSANLASAGGGVYRSHPDRGVGLRLVFRVAGIHWGSVEGEEHHLHVAEETSGASHGYVAKGAQDSKPSVTKISRPLRLRFMVYVYLAVREVGCDCLPSCLEGTASKPPKQDNCATKRHAPFSFSLEPKQVGKPKMSITDMTGHMECMVVSECLWDDCILSTPPSGSIPYLVASINLLSCSRTDGKVTDA